MDEPTTSRIPRWKSLLHRFRAFVRAAAPFAAGVLAAFLGLFLYGLLFPGPHQITTSEVNDSVASALASATAPPPYSEVVYQIIQPSLVLIESKSPAIDGKTDDSLGSGVIIDDQGDIITAFHVVGGAASIQVTFADGTQAGASVAVKQPANDIAILHPDKLPSQVVPAILGNPNNMRVGDEAYAVGNPYGLYSSMSAGVISGFNRSFHPTDTDLQLKGLIQIDTAVNPGNSGGPLLNREGQVIGIVEGLVNPTQQDFFVGIGFAIPINSALSAFGGSPID